MFKRILAIFFIYLCTSLAWVALGSAVQFRTYNQDEDLRHAVGQLWGTVQRQRAPEVSYQIAGETEGEPGETDPTIYRMDIEASDVDVSLDLEHRRKGLLWYSTYRVQFSGRYQVYNNVREDRLVSFELPLPARGAIYDNFHFIVGGEEVGDFQIDSGSLKGSFPLIPGQRETVEVSYASQGLDEWWYEFGEGVTRVKDFSLAMQTDFEDIDFPEQSMSPTTKEQTPKGWELGWDYDNLLSEVQIGMVMPRKLNPGPWVSRVIYFAPVSLFLFFFLLFLFTTVKEIKVHPMNYFFVGAAFFSYHLLLAYLVDHVSIHLAFWICSAVSIFLVVSYMRLVVGPRFAFVQVGIAQFVYLVLFSYTFFFEGYTGLTLTVMCIVTLFIIMQFTGRVDWEDLFRRGGKKEEPGVIPG